MSKWSFQLEAAKKLCSDVESPMYIGACLYAAVGSGKTQILIHTMNLLLKEKPSCSILYLAYAQKNLKNQTLETFADPLNPVRPDFSFGTLNENKSVTVAIPQEFNRASQNYEFDYLVIDEGHVWFTSDSVLIKIIKKFKLRKIIISSGTASTITRYNNWTDGKKFAMTYISGEEMLNRGIYSAVDIDLVKVDATSDANTTLKQILLKAKNHGDSMEKPVIICKSNQQAEKAALFFRIEGYEVALATAKNDPKNIEICKFKNGEKNCLILIERGLLGLNIPAATSMVCLKGSQNIELIAQYTARMYRQHPDGRKKFFWRATTAEKWNRDVVLLNRVQSLNKIEVMQKYCGKSPSNQYCMEAA